METPVLYSFRRCPYAMRARLALASAEVRVELREVLLRDKPAELLVVSPKATVPVLVDGAAVIDESYDIMLWALQRNDPEGWLARHDDELVKECEGPFKSALDRYKYATRYEGVDPVAQRALGADFVQKLEAVLHGHPYLGGKQPGFTDMATITFVRQFANVDRRWFDSQNWPHVSNWLQDFLESPRFAAIMGKYPIWMAGDSPTYFPEAKMTDTRLTKLEEQLTHQHHVTEELSEVVAAQAKQIDTMERRIALLLKRAAEAEADTLSGGPLADQRPPHW